ncbi:MAG TPA: phosphatase PAP2 family protein [Longimicrobiaceae bacterium]|nr:phosphatase PAP2 family protein [Longimicrobiaceae bacterium]
MVAVRNSLRPRGMTNRYSRTSEPRDRKHLALALGAVACAAAAGFAALAAAVVRRDTAGVDEAVRDLTAPPPRHPARRAAAALAPVGKWWSYVPAALGPSIFLLTASGASGSRARRSRRAGAGAILAAAATATALNPAFDRWLPQPPAPPGHASRRKPVFPSGHAFGPSAVSLASAYVLAREGLARPAVAFPVALMVPLVSAGGRMIEEKHWASDVLGGYLGGTAVAAACVSAYEAAGGV